MDIVLIQYMHDLFLAYPGAVYLQRTAKKVFKGLTSLYLIGLPDKVPIIIFFVFLDFSIAKQVSPLSFNFEDEEIVLILRITAIIWHGSLI